MNAPSQTPKRWIVARRLRKWHRRRGLGIADCRGSVAVEFALLLPVFLAIVVGMVEISRVVFTSHSLDFAVREATRYAMVRSATSADPATTSSIEDVIKARTTGLDPTKLNVTVSYAPNNAPGSVVTVRANYDFRFLAPIVPIDPISLTSSSQMIVTN